VLLITILVSLLYAWSGNKKRYALLFPIGTTVLLTMFARALYLCATGEILWRGTRYNASLKVAAETN
jgi:hypothetical protein